MNRNDMKAVVAAWAMNDKRWWSFKTAWAFMGTRMNDAELQQWVDRMWATTPEGKAEAESAARRFAEAH